RDDTYVSILRLYSVIVQSYLSSLSLFFFTDTATTEIYTLSLHDALPIFLPSSGAFFQTRALELFHRRRRAQHCLCGADGVVRVQDRKSTRLNSSHRTISYAVFCLKKKNIIYNSYFI